MPKPTYPAGRKPATSRSVLKQELRTELLALLRKQGFTVGRDRLLKGCDYEKEDVRAIHVHSRQLRLLEERTFTQRWFSRVAKYFASGSDVNPYDIDPYPVLVGQDEELAALFRIASLWWSVPVSRGFGRRFRILVFDRSNGKLFGLLGMTDPVFNLRTRDQWIGWTVRDREKRLASVMDAYVLGAVPPYNQLLGAKLIALLASSDHIRAVFKQKYGNVKSVILQRRAESRLALVTATSALGRSSIYNRLRYGGVDVFQLVGFTEGYGHFHLANGTFEKLRHLLQTCGDDEGDRYKFGNGPNYRIRVARRALEHLDLPPDLLRHGIHRAVYLSPLAENTAAFLRGEAERLRWYPRPFDEMVEHWRTRWLLPRKARDDSYSVFDKNQWKEIAGLGKLS